MSDAPDFIWAKTTLGNADEGYWNDCPIVPNIAANQGVPYVRRDPAVLAELPEVQAMVAAAFCYGGQTEDGLAALDAHVAAEVRKALERAKAKIGGYYAARGEPCHDIEVGDRLAMENAIEIIDAMIEDAPSPDPG